MNLPVCDICEKAVSVQDGTIWIGYDAINKAEEARRKWDSESSDIGVFSTQFGELPQPALWMWGHRGCTDQDGANEYWIDAERFAMPADALAWTLHLLEKTWFRATDWETLVRRLHDVPST